MSAHVSEVHDQSVSSARDFICGVCKHEFQEAENYNAHMRTHEAQSGEFLLNKATNEDELCSLNEMVSPMPTHSEATERLTSHHIEGKSGDDLKEHMDTHRTYKCDKCKFRTKVSKEMPGHMKAHGETNANILAAVEVVNNKQDGVKKLETCPFCKLESKNLDALRTHIENIHQLGSDDQQSSGIDIDEIVRESNETVSRCPHCSFIGNIKDMENHIIKTHGSVAICGECGKTFPDIQECENHLREAHPEIEPFQCDECSKTFVNFNNLMDHKTKEHKRTETVVPIPWYTENLKIL